MDSFYDQKENLESEPSMQDIILSMQEHLLDQPALSNSVSNGGSMLTSNFPIDVDKYKLPHQITKDYCDEWRHVTKHPKVNKVRHATARMHITVKSLRIFSESKGFPLA